MVHLFTLLRKKIVLLAITSFIYFLGRTRLVLGITLMLITDAMLIMLITMI